MSASLVSGFYDQPPSRQTVLGLTHYSIQVSSGDAVSLTIGKIIRNGTREPLVRDVGQSITKVGAVITRLGGYDEQSTQSWGIGKTLIAEKHAG